MSNNLWLEEVYVNATKKHIIDESEAYESFTDDLGELYKSLQKEHGRCVSKLYRDTPKGERAVGWIFESLQKYEDARDNRHESYYMRQVLVTVFKSKPVKHVTWDVEYAEVGR